MYSPGDRVYIETRRKALGPYTVLWQEGEDVCIAPESSPEDEVIINGSFVWIWEGES